MRSKASRAIGGLGRLVHLEQLAAAMGPTRCMLDAGRPTEFGLIVDSADLRVIRSEWSGRTRFSRSTSLNNAPHTVSLPRMIPTAPKPHRSQAQAERITPANRPLFSNLLASGANISSHAIADG
jgi:hypothetical protein